MNIIRDEIKTSYIPEGTVRYLCVVPEHCKKVLYWLHGFQGDENELMRGLAEYEAARTGDGKASFEGNFAEAEHLLKKFSEKYEAAVVMPSLGGHFYVDAEWKKRYIGKFIAEELVPVTRKRYSFPAEKEKTYIGGASMGGFGALLQGFHFPELYGGVIAISSPLILEGATEENPDPKVWCGLPSDYFVKLFGENFLRNPAVNPERAAEQIIKEWSAKEWGAKEGSTKEWSTNVQIAKERGANAQMVKKQCPVIYMACSESDPPIDKYNQKVFWKWKEQGLPITGMEPERCQNVARGHNWKYFAEELYKAMEYFENRADLG